MRYDTLCTSALFMCVNGYNKRMMMHGLHQKQYQEEQQKIAKREQSQKMLFFYLYHPPVCELCVCVCLFYRHNNIAFFAVVRLCQNTHVRRISRKMQPHITKSKMHKIDTEHKQFIYLFTDNILGKRGKCAVKAKQMQAMNTIQERIFLRHCVDSGSRGMSVMGNDLRSLFQTRCEEAPPQKKNLEVLF